MKTTYNIMFTLGPRRHPLLMHSGEPVRRAIATSRLSLTFPCV
jgi:hypothetical protein